MYTKDKLFRLTVRLNANQLTFVKMTADVLGVSPSEFLRMIINGSMGSSNNGENRKI